MRPPAPLSAQFLRNRVSASIAPTTSFRQIGAVQINHLPPPPIALPDAASFALSSSPIRQPLVERHQTLYSDDLNPPPIRGSQYVPPEAAQAPIPIQQPLEQSHHSTYSTLRENRARDHAAGPVTITANLPPSSLPNSSLSSSSTDSSQRPGDVAANLDATPRGRNAHPILTSLLESTSIYNLSASALEILVGEVIREDGFLQLVRALRFYANDF